MRQELIDASGPVRVIALAAAPVPYQVPLYRLLAKDPRIDLTVAFASDEGIRRFELGFGEPIDWGIDLISGYRSVFLHKAGKNRVTRGFAALLDLDILPIVRSGAYDALWIHGYSYGTHWLAMLAAASRHIPVLIREEQTLLHSRPRLKEAVRSAILGQVFSHTFGLCIGTNNRDFFLHYGMPSDRLYFAPYCVDNAALQKEAQLIAPDRPRLRAELRLPPDPTPVVLFSGRLVPKKQPIQLLKAYARVRGKLNCALLIVGDGPLRGEMERFVASERIPDVVFVGFQYQDHLARAYAASDIFVLPSGSHETWGIVVNEAMNFSLPILTTDMVGSSADLVRTGDNGFVVPAGDLDALTRSLEQLIVSPELRQRMGNQSLSRIRQWHYGTAAEGIIQAALAATGRRHEQANAGRWESPLSGVRN
jgi:glycosyltransferase involved in cell wall biosynthesis